MTLFLGILGSVIILACFIANELNWLNRHSITYDAGNVIGSIVLLIYSFELMSWPFFILNFVWGLVALRDLLKTLAGAEKNR